MVDEGVDDVTIRPVCEDDCDKGLFDVLSQLTQAPHIERADFSRLLQRQQQQDARWTIVAASKKDGRVLATGSVMIEPKFIRGGKPCGHIEDIVVDKGARGLHLGQRIIQTLVKYCEQKECYKVILDCADENVQFYEKCGFKVKERQMAQYF